jgi:hypothetical protein
MRLARGQDDERIEDSDPNPRSSFHQVVGMAGDGELRVPDPRQLLRVSYEPEGQETGRVTVCRSAKQGPDPIRP